ncbi:hypothetical protein T552_01949 [Pneumocystis carinii B80]|uniref:DNA endonuclease activator Ctp1 C-terminal domain-containing protein n=1 Tax=Pneumocystis carinii (strain B80) TaxID=1408658 RepID=A0A0W4ZI99_PNEC8|nr:hypothetical protein T552_01949 [Pneumocystis carinii B80]KTW28088.1 hypothetical protein T552_01949 [Pneumocystis carinii B80]
MEEKDIIREFSREIDDFNRNLLNITFEYKNLQKKKLEKFSEYCRKYEETIDYQNNIIRSLIKERNKEIQVIHEYKDQLEKEKHHELLLDYNNYIKSICKKSLEYDILLFFLDRYEKMKESLLYLSKKYRKDKKKWKEYINYYEIDKKCKDHELSKGINSLNGKKSSGENSDSNLQSLLMNKVDSNKPKTNSQTLESLVLSGSSKPNMSPSSSILSECLDKYIFDNQKDACHIGECLYNDSTTEDESETIKSFICDSNIKELFNDSKVNEEEKSNLFKSVTSNNNPEIHNYNLDDIKKNENNSLKSFSKENIEGFHDISKNLQTMTPKSEQVEKNTVLNISKFLPTPKPDSRSIYLKTELFNKQKDMNKENISKISIDLDTSHTFSTFSNVQSLANETMDTLKTNKEYTSNTDLGSILLKKKKDILIIDSSSEKEIIENTLTTKKSNSDENTNLKRRISLQHDENNKLDKKNEFASNFDNKKLGRYAKKSKNTEESLNDYVIDLNKNDNIPYAYGEVVRDKASRKHLPACACDNCIKFFEAHGPIATIFKPQWRSPSKKEVYTDSNKDHIYKNLQEVSRHRAAFFRPKTPPGFWESDFPNTQQEQIYRKQAQAQNNERLKERQLEAERGGRWKKKV